MSSSRWLWAASLVLVAALGYQYWKDNQIPAPSLEPGERAGSVNLAAPTRVEIHHEQTQSSIMIAQDRPAGDERLGGRTPEVFERPAIATGSLALARNQAPALDERPWWQRLDAKFFVLVIAAVFLAVYGVLTAALKKGPGGGPMSND